MVRSETSDFRSIFIALVAALAAWLPSSAEAALVKAINMNGPQITAEGVTYLAAASANVTVRGAGTNVRDMALSPAPGDLAAVILSFVWNAVGNMTIEIPITNGNYQVYLLIWEDTEPVNFQLKFEGVSQGGTMSSGAVGTWRRIGPFNASVGDGNLTINATGGGLGISAIEIHSEERTLQPSGLVKAVNLNGQEVTASGIKYLAQSASGTTVTGNGTFVFGGTMSPAVGDLTSVLSSAVWNAVGRMTIEGPVANGNYLVNLLTLEDNEPIRFQLAFEGVVQNGTMVSPAAGTWQRLGPFRASVNDGRLTITATGEGVGLSAVEIYQTTTAPTTVPTPVATPVPTPVPTPAAPPSNGVPRGPVSGPTHTSEIVISGKSNLTIDGANFTNSSGRCLSILNSSNIVVKNASFINCWGVGIYIYGSQNIRVERSYFENLNGGVYAERSTGISVTTNNFKNVHRMQQDTARGQFVQFNGVTGAGNEVRLNRGINILGESNPEDLVNVFNSQGTAASPITIAGNCFTGGGPSPSGGGLMSGDYGGAYITIQDNTLINPGQYGIGVAGGTNIKILNNKVYGAAQSFTNVGIYMWNITPAYSCANNTIQGNRVQYYNKSGQSSGYWDAGNCPGSTVSNNDFDAKDLGQMSCPLY